jgi:hypothetical protein
VLIMHPKTQQAGFFRHPVLVVNVDDTHAWFYALTSRLPTAISDLGMFLQLGRTSVDEGPGILRLEEISGPMQSVTYVNLEQRFKIEKPYLRTWAADVTIAEGELFKVQVKVDWLEAQQYRFIYKPLDRDLSGVLPGTVLMMPNAAGASTLGAPVLIVRNEYPLMEYLRIKLVKDHASLNKSSSLSPSDLDFRRRCLAIAPRGNIDHDETPIMELEPESPNMREPSYVDIHRNVKRGRLDRCKTWCFPPVKVCPQSVEMLKAYMAQLETHPPAPQPPLPHKSNGHIPGNWQGHFRGPPTSIKNAPTQVYGSRHRQDSIMGPSMPITTGHENRVEHFSLSALPTPNTIWHDPMYGHSHASGYNARPPLGYRAPLQSININLNARTYNYNMSYHVINDYSPGHGYGNGYGYEYNNAHYHVTPAPVRNVQHFSPSGPSCYSPSHVNEDIKENIASHLQQSYMPNEGAISMQRPPP